MPAPRAIVVSVPMLTASSAEPTNPSTTETAYITMIIIMKYIINLKIILDLPKPGSFFAKPSASFSPALLKVSNIFDAESLLFFVTTSGTVKKKPNAIATRDIYNAGALPAISKNT